MTNPIVKINVSTVQAPAPSILQKTGALISQGGTNTSPGTVTFLATAAGLTSILNGAKTLTSLTWSGNFVTATTTSPHGFTVGDTLPITVTGAAPAGYNTTATAYITGASTFIYPLATNPGANTTPGSYTDEDVTELTSMVNTFFAQGSTQGVSVLELGAGNASDGVTYLTSWLTANPNVFYAFLVPRYWDGNSSFLTLVGQYEAQTAKTYFLVTTTLSTYKLYTAQMKSVLTMVESPAYGAWAANALTAISFSAGTIVGGAGIVTATTTTAHGVAVGQWFTIQGCTPAGYNGTFQALPGTTGSTLLYGVSANPGVESVLGTLAASYTSNAGVPSGEFDFASVLFTILNYAPSSTNRVTPLNLAFLFGVTPYPTQGNGTVLAALNTANVNVVGTGSAGGISDSILIGGDTMDGNPFNYWYSVDWVQINAALNVTNALINGSNNPTNPLYYNQAGINTLQAVLIATMNQGISDGLVLNPVKATTLSAAAFQAALNADTYGGFTVVNADPFASYTVENPNDYGNGVYNGLSIIYVPLRGFSAITININVSQFAA